MLAAEDKARRQAMDWLIMLRDPATADWVGFTEWLEADPVNNQAYEAAALADDAIVAALARSDVSPAGPASSNDNDEVAAPGRRGFFVWSAGAAAAVLAVAIGPPMLQQQPQPYVIATGAGEHRSVTLDDGTRVELNGDSRLSVANGKARTAALDRGEATFTVVHDEAHPFVVTVGEHEVRDVGTVFNIARSPDAIEIAVAEGSVLFNPAREAVSLKKGQFLRLGVQHRNLVKDDRNVIVGRSRADPCLGTGAWALDQSWHIFWGVFVAALVIAA
jgi:transmembrane sensor